MDVSQQFINDLVGNGVTSQVKYLKEFRAAIIQYL